MPKKSGVVTSPIARGSTFGPGTAIDFIERYLVLPDRREPVMLHQYQQDLIEQWCDPTTKAHATVIGAGNAKTATLAAFVTAHLFLTDEANVPVVADTLRQAWDTTLGRAKRYVELCPDLLDRAEILEGQGSRSGIYVPGMASHAFAVADKVGGLQGLQPSLTCLEEMSVASQDTFAALMARQGKRPGAKLLGISTPSFMEDNALLQVQRAVRSGQPMPGVVLTEFISEQRDHRDEVGWLDANPGLGTEPVVLDINALRTDVALMPEQSFRCYRLCQNPTGSESCWLNALDEDGNELGDAYDIWQRGLSAHAFKEGAPTWVGIDVAKSYDNAAVVWGQFRDDGTLHVKCKVWTPTLADIDLDDIADHLRMLAGKYDLRAIWYDPSYFYNAPALAKELPMIEVPPTDVRMAPMVLHAYQSIRRSRVTHDDDPVLTQHVLAARRRYGASGFTIEKRNYLRKIDACVALVLCVSAATGYSAPPVDQSTFRIF